MIKRIAAASTLACLGLPAPLAAQEADTATVTVSTQEFSDDYGSLRTMTMEYELVEPDMTVLFTPAVGQRRAPGLEETAVGAGVTVYRTWSPAVSTRTSAFFAEDAPVFARYSFAQDVTVNVGKSTAVTLGGRYAQYFGNRDVTSLSVGARQYFGFGSVSYRLSRVDPEGHDAFLAHLINVSINDPSGAGRTQLWLSAGEASLSTAQVPDNFSGKDYAAVLRRVQPVGGNLSLLSSVGYSSYDRLAGRIDALSLGLGLAWTLE
jgi:YaiO family outer membrane protein